MEWYERFEPQIGSVFQQAKRRIAQFPAPLHTIGQQYAEKFNPVADGGKDYICVLLPCWMQETTGISDEQCEQLALANVYGMLYFFIQDDVMDSAQPERFKPLLALANLLNLEMLTIFRALFSSDSPFWSYYDYYITNWADCVMNESDTNYFMNDPIRTAGKASPVKISSTGACLLAGQADLIEAAEAGVDLALMTLQMLDDWFDWKEDLAEGSYNGLLAMIAYESGLSIAQLSKEKIESHIYVLGCMSRYSDIAHRNHERLLALPSLPQAMIDYHSFMADSLKELAERLEDNKRKLMGGGLNLFLSV